MQSLFFWGIAIFFPVWINFPPSTNKSALFASYIEIQMTSHDPYLLSTRIINRRMVENSDSKEVWRDFHVKEQLFLHSPI